jgi:CheY-like chemotaxis protein
LEACRETGTRVNQVFVGLSDSDAHIGDCPGFCNGIAESLRVRAEAKGLSFAVEQSGDIPTTVRADTQRLRQVLINLLDNAIKYTEVGKVTLNVGYHQGRLRFGVADTGVGIPPEQLPHIFDAFYQIRNGRAFVEGAGLGLAISKRLVGLMGGTLEVRSTPNEGSVFAFDLSLSEATTALVSADRGRRILGVSGVKPKILVVDDDPANRQVLSDMLTPLGFILREAGDGQAALTHAAAWRPDVILMDMRMPVMDGFEAIRRIRATEALHKVVILAISASAFEHNRRQCLEAGADDFLRKPCRLEELTDLLRRHLGLEWIYGQVDSRAQDTEAPPSPFLLPESDRTMLLDLARRGDIKKILAEADRLDQVDPRCAPVLQEVRALAKRFQVKRLCQFLEAVHTANSSKLPRSQPN